MTNIEEIAKGLSEAQRGFVLGADPADPFCPKCAMLIFAEETDGMMNAYPAHDDPDCSIDDAGGTRFSWTDTGKAVRKYLMENDCD